MPEASSGRGRRGQDDDGEQGFIRNDPPELEDTYRFSFDANWLVTSMVEIDDGVEKVKDLTGRTFTVTTGVNDLQQTDAVEVIQTRVKRGVSETTVFEDQDGDDIYTQAFELEIYGADARPNKVEEYQFTFDTNGDVTGYSKLKKGVWVAKSIDANESFETLDLSGTTVVAKTEVEGTKSRSNSSGKIRPMPGYGAKWPRPRCRLAVPITTPWSWVPLRSLSSWLVLPGLLAEAGVEFSVGFTRSSVPGEPLSFTGHTARMCARAPPTSKD